MEEAREHPAVERGSDPTLVLLPGLDGTGFLFDPLLAALPPEISTLTCGYPGDFFLPPACLAKTVAERIADHGEVVILAESWSGLVCLELLRQKPANVAGVIFVACFAEPPRPVLLSLSRLLPLSMLMRLPLPAAMVRRYCLGAQAGAGQLTLFRKALAAVRPEVLAARVKSLRHFGPYEEPIVPSAFYIQAAQDRLIPPSSVDAFREMSPNVAVHRVEGPHFLLQSRPAECAVVVADFVRRLAVPAH